jgi:hypothetical protein
MIIIPGIYVKCVKRKMGTGYAIPNFQWWGKLGNARIFMHVLGGETEVIS